MPENDRPMSYRDLIGYKLSGWARILVRWAWCVILAFRLISR
jgi:hypothetical protein